MPILRALTLKFKTSKAKLSVSSGSPPASPSSEASTTSPTASCFEAMGRNECQRNRSETSKSMRSIESEYVPRTPTKSVETFERISEDKKQRRMSRFKEELEDGD